MVFSNPFLFIYLLLFCLGETGLNLERSLCFCEVLFTKKDTVAIWIFTIYYGRTNERTNGLFSDWREEALATRLRLESFFYYFKYLLLPLLLPLLLLSAFALLCLIEIEPYDGERKGEGLLLLLRYVGLRFSYYSFDRHIYSLTKSGFFTIVGFSIAPAF